MEKLRQAILIYQASAIDLQSRNRLTRRTGISTTVNIQPTRPLDSELLLPVFDFGTQRSVGQFKTSFGVLLKLHEAREHINDQRRRITRLQKSPVKNKIESVRAQLDRIGKDGDTARNADEFRRRKFLFEYVCPNCREWLPTLNWSQNSRGDQGQAAAPI